MADTMYFDTHAFAQKLTSAGFTPQQVDTLIDLARDSTPRDLVTNTSLDSRLTILEQRMTIKLGGLIVAGVAFVTTFMRFLPPAS